MDDHDDQKLLLEILAEVKESRGGIRSLDAIVRKLESEVSGIQANAGRLEAAFQRHMTDADRAREERAAFDKRLALLESLFNEFLKREVKRDERDSKTDSNKYILWAALATGVLSLITQLVGKVMN